MMSNEDEKFKIIEYMRKLIIYLDNILINFPNKYLELKRILFNEIYDILKQIYITNDIVDKKIKLNKSYEIVSRIKYLNFIINRCYDKKIITKKHYLNVGYIMSNLIKYLNGWINYLKKV